MGIVYAEITLKNAGDIVKAQCGYITEQEIRAVKVRALADTGAGTLVINEELMRHLGLGVRGLRKASLANGRTDGPLALLWPYRIPPKRFWGLSPLKTWI